MNKGQTIKNLITIKFLIADKWQVWRKPRLHALAEDLTAFCSTLADWQGENDTEPRWRARLKPFRIIYWPLKVKSLSVWLVLACQIKTLR